MESLNYNNTFTKPITIKVNVCESIEYQTTLLKIKFPERPICKNLIIGKNE